LEELDRDYTASFAARPQYIQHSAFPFANTYPVIPILLRQLAELEVDPQSTWAARPQYVKHSSFPFDLTYPVIPVQLRKLSELDIDFQSTWAARPRYIEQGSFPFANTYPVIPISLRRLLELDLDYTASVVRPGYSSVIPPPEVIAPANVVIPILVRWWLEEPERPLRHSHHKSYSFTEEVAAANLIVPISLRRLYELTNPSITFVRPQYIPQGTFPFDLTYIVLPPKTRDLAEWEWPEAFGRPQFFQLVPSIAGSPANIVIPYMHTSWQPDGSVVLHITGPGYSANIPFPTEEAAADFCGLYLDWIGRCRRKVRRKV